jgi:uncharacterized small protein (DUF1192 family)
MSEPLSNLIEATIKRHPEVSPVAASMIAAAALHQRIAELESELAKVKQERDEWRKCAERLHGFVFSDAPINPVGEMKEALAEFSRLQAKSP